MLGACGITEFLLPVKYICTARIKQQPEDFIVVEVDPTGKRTDNSEYQLPIPVPISTEEITQTIETPSDEIINTDFITINPEEDLLTDTTKETLINIFGSKHDAIKQFSPSVNGKDAAMEEKEYFIGVLNLKEQRRQLHYALKNSFPYLNTITRYIPSTTSTTPTVSSSSLVLENSSNSNTNVLECQVIVKYDMNYLFIAYLLGESAADIIESWSHMKSRSATFHYRALFPEETTKEMRRAFHEMISRRHPDLTCRVVNGELTIKASFRLREKRAREEDNNNNTNLFTHFLIRKCNLEMMEFRMLLAEYFHVPSTTICTAGLKDKRGITYQRCSIPGSWKKKLYKHNKKKEENNNNNNNNNNVLCRLSWPNDPLSYLEILQVSEPFSLPIHIGQLNGNWFKIRLLDIQGISSLELAQRVKQVESNGFLNYFGQQRFSENVKSIKDHIGIHLLAGRWAEAVRSVLYAAPGLYETFPNKMEVRYIPDNARDAQCVVQSLQRIYRSQRHISHFTLLSSEDIINSSIRWQELCRDALLAIPYSLRSLWVQAAQSLIFNLMLSKLHHKDVDMIKTVHALPLVGYKMIIEDNLKPIFDEVLNELQLNIINVLEQKKVVGVPMPGSMRDIIARPMECSFEIEDNNNNIIIEKEEDKEKSFNASISFFLPSSCYATIFLREVLGCDQWW